MSIPVESFGLYVDGPTSWLVQGRGGTNFIGSKQKCPFVGPKGLMCNHLVPVAAPVPDVLHWQQFLPLMKDPLVEAMLPIPRSSDDRAFFVEDPSDDLGYYLSCLSRLSSPIKNIIRPAWMVKANELEGLLKESNIQPWVMNQTKGKQQAVVSAITDASAYLPRTVIITGTDDLSVRKPMKRITTNIREFNLQDLMTLPLETIGAAILRRHARREDIYAPMESRQARRERIIKERTHAQAKGLSTR